MGHVFNFDKSWEMLIRDPKRTNTPTSMEVKFKSSWNSSSFDISDAQTHINLNADTNKITVEIKEISTPRRPVGQDKVKRAAKHAYKVVRKAKHMEEIEAKFKEHNLIQKEKNDLWSEHLDFLRRKVE